MPLSVGYKLGPYEILEPVGAGGMGEVLKARDTRLDRVVAIKTSSKNFSEWFEREARAIAALNHPNICQIYDVGPDYLVMEYVEGSEIKGPLPLDQALRAAIQLADALDAAHSQVDHVSRSYWRRDGEELYFLNGTKLEALEVKASGSSFEAGIPKDLFDVPLVTDAARRNQLCADGRWPAVPVCDQRRRAWTPRLSSWCRTGRPR